MMPRGTLKSGGWTWPQEDRVEYTALINIRPAQGNRSMEVTDPDLRQKIREITSELLGQGEED